MNQMKEKFDKGFKKKEVKLTYTGGNTEEIANKTGVDRALVFQRHEHFKQPDTRSHSGNNNLKVEDLKHQNALLRKELKIAKGKRRILKMAISIFSTSDEKTS